MVDQFNRHLTFREIELAGEDSLPAERLSHAGTCAECAEAVETHRMIQHKIGPREDFEPANGGAECPAAEELSGLIAGDLPEDDAARVMDHASVCGRCSAILRGATDEAPANETALVVPIAARASELLAACGPTRRDWRWAAAAAAVVGAAGVWYAIGQRSAPERLLAMAYTEARPFEMRLPDRGYGPVRTQRAGTGSAPGRPQELLQAEAEIQGRGASPETLLLRGRAELLEGRYDAAIESLTRAERARAGDAEAEADLGCAYLLEGDAEHRAIDYGHGVDLLREAVKARPEDPRMLFDLALAYERAARPDEAIAAWKRFLQREKDPGWAAEARERLSELQQR